MILVYKNTAYNTDRIAKMTMDTKSKKLSIYGNFDANTQPEVIAWDGDKDKEAKANALWNWYHTNGTNIEPKP